MDFGRRKAFLDKYDQRIEVGVDEGDADVCMSLDFGAIAMTALEPDDADKLGDQLKAAAAYARTVTPHD